MQITDLPVDDGTLTIHADEYATLDDGDKRYIRDLLEQHGIEFKSVMSATFMLTGIATYLPTDSGPKLTFTRDQLRLFKAELRFIRKAQPVAA